MMKGKKTRLGSGVVGTIAALSSLVFLGCPVTPPASDTDDRKPCRVDADCPRPSVACVSASCASGVCVDVPEDAGRSASILQQPRDCHRLLCDGKGGTVNVVDDTDTPNDNNPCTEDTCQDGSAVFLPLGRWENVTGCDVDFACDGAGKCLKVNFAACKKPSECVSGACYTTSVLSEGVCRKLIGEACAGGEECESNLCDASGRCAACDVKTCALGACFNGACFEKCTQQANCDNGYTCAGTGLCVNDCPSSPCRNGEDCVNSICIPQGG
jgi:hypothetical protein